MGKMLKSLEPCGHRVLIKLEKVNDSKEIVNDWGFVEEIRDSQEVQREQHASQAATVIQLGCNAFKDYGDGRPWCEVGDKVRVVRYSGDDLKDIEEGEIYRIVNDIDIVGKYKEE